MQAASAEVQTCRPADRSKKIRYEKICMQVAENGRKNVDGLLVLGVFSSRHCYRIRHRRIQPTRECVETLQMDG